jgi:hypothetical protein
LTASRRATWVLGRRPDAIVLASRDARRLRALYATDAAIARNPGFRPYRLEEVARGGGGQCMYDLFVYRASISSPRSG